jgi:hypothetical protein
LADSEAKPMRADKARSAVLTSGGEAEAC